MCPKDPVSKDPSYPPPLSHPQVQEREDWRNQGAQGELSMYTSAREWELLLSLLCLMSSSRNWKIVTLGCGDVPRGPLVAIGSSLQGQLWL